MGQAAISEKEKERRKKQFLTKDVMSIKLWNKCTFRNIKEKKKRASASFQWLMIHGRASAAVRQGAGRLGCSLCKSWLMMLPPLKLAGSRRRCCWPSAPERLHWLETNAPLASACPFQGQCYNELSRWEQKFTSHKAPVIGLVSIF